MNLNNFMYPPHQSNLLRLCLIISIPGRPILFVLILFVFCLFFCYLFSKLCGKVSSWLVHIPSPLGNLWHLTLNLLSLYFCLLGLSLLSGDVSNKKSNWPCILLCFLNFCVGPWLLIFQIFSSALSIWNNLTVCVNGFILGSRIDFILFSSICIVCLDCCQLLIGLNRLISIGYLIRKL